MAAPQPNYVVIGNCFDQLRDGVIKIQNQPGTAQQISNFAHDTNNCFDRCTARECYYTAREYYYTSREHYRSSRSR